MKKFLLSGVAAIALGSAAQAADLGSPRAPVAAAVMMPSFSWTGIYGGLNLGLGIANGGWAVPIPGFSGSATGLAFGGQLGFNYQINNFVLGLEGDVGFLNPRRSTDFGGLNFRWRQQWDGSIRGRVGVAADRALFYFTGGIAFTDIGVRVTNAGVLVGAASQNRTGYTLGAGAEYAFTPNWTVRGEYLYANYGTKDFVGVRQSLTDHKLRIGVNYLFSTGSSAVVARY